MEGVTGPLDSAITEEIDDGIENAHFGERVTRNRVNLYHEFILCISIRF